MFFGLHAGEGESFYYTRISINQSARVTRTFNASLRLSGGIYPEHPSPHGFAETQLNRLNVLSIC